MLLLITYTYVVLSNTLNLHMFVHSPYSEGADGVHLALITLLHVNSMGQVR